jgi:hypothetical protein
MGSGYGFSMNRHDLTKTEIAKDAASGCLHLAMVLRPQNNVN